MQRNHPHTLQKEPKSAPMPIRPYAHLLPTLFDRLRDDAPHRRTELASEISLSQNELLQIIYRDLGYLLNTVNIANTINLEAFPVAEASTINYGISPLAGGYLSEKKWRNIERIIRRAILNFEPRLLPDSLSVIPLANGESSHHYNILQFEISALVHADPYPIEFLVQSSVDLESSRLSLLPLR